MHNNQSDIVWNWIDDLTTFFLLSKRTIIEIIKAIMNAERNVITTIETVAHPLS